MELIGFVHPFHGPFGLLLDDFHVLDSIEKEPFFIIILYIRIYQKRVSLRVNVFHSDLEPVKTSGFGNLDLRTELFCQILEDDAITCGEES